MQLPIQTHPVYRRGTRVDITHGLSPSACFYSGTAPFCNGQEGDCLVRGMQYCGNSDCGDGSCCWTGHKVLCCDVCPS